MLDDLEVPILCSFYENFKFQKFIGILLKSEHKIANRNLIKLWYAFWCAVLNKKVTWLVSVKDTCQWFLLCPTVNLAKCGQTFDKVVNYPAETSILTF